MDVRIYKCNVCKSQKDVDVKDFEKQIINSANSVGVEIKTTCITDREKANAEGVWQLPAIAINGELVVAGYFPKDKELNKIFGKQK